MARLVTAEDEGAPEEKSCTYRSVKALPFELREHCVIYFEEHLYTTALSLLHCLLTAGSQEARDIPAHVPSTQLLQLIATLIVFPRLTRKSDRPENLAAANAALYYLCSVNKIVGPVNANFAAAFVFAGNEGLRSKRSYGRRRDTVPEHEGGDRSSAGSSAEEEEVIQNPAAMERSLWIRGKDFWHVVGWSFNCSVRWKGRWERWKLWLEFMLEVLQDDFRERVRLMKEGHPNGEALVQESLAMQYFGAEARAGRTERRKIMRAIFATGTTKDVAEFVEVFEKETKERKAKQPEVRGVKRRKINVEEGDFGDYYDENDEDEDGEVKKEIKEEPGLRSSTRTSRGATRTTAVVDAEVEAESDVDKEEYVPATDPIEAYGGTEALLLRRRILVLLTTLSATLPTHTPPLEDLFDIYTEFLRPLALPVFLTFTTTTSSTNHPTFHPAIHSSLLKTLLRPLLSPTAPRSEDPYITQPILERCYLPFPAASSSVVDNAKVSLVLETLVRLLKGYGGLVGTQELREAVRRGVLARGKRAVVDGRRKGGRRAEEVEAGGWLEGSGRRLGMLVGVLGG